MENQNARNLMIGLTSLGVMSVAVLGFLGLAWVFLYFGLYLGLGNYRVRGHQEFAVNGVAQIEPASQMEEVFEDCRHYITYSGDHTSPIWNSVAFFGGRYQLTMQVPVQIRSAAEGRMAGQPQYLLLEVERVDHTPDGRVQTSFGQNIRFGPDEWRKVYEADGDFSAAGFKIGDRPPVTGFDDFAAAHR